MTIRDKLLRAVARYDLISPGDRLLVGVSGGQDSVTLALLLAELAAELQISLVIAHLHHGLRGEEGDADRQFAADLAATLGLPFVSEETDVAALGRTAQCGLEEAGRLARYRFFERAAAEHQCGKIALAHTATDRAETLLMNLFRGAGLHGLRSIPPRRDHIIRPLLLCSRQETGDYCANRGVEPCHDACNADRHHLRNRLRADLMPQLERDYGPDLEQSLCRAADCLWDEIEWTEPLVAQALAEAGTEEVSSLSLPALQAMPSGLRQRVLRRFLQQCSGGPKDVSQERWLALEALIKEGQTGRRIELGLGRSVQLEYDLLRMCDPNESVAQSDFCVRLVIPGAITLADGTVIEAALTALPPCLPAACALQAVLDARRAGGTLLVRPPRPGDRFTPLGLEGTKKLQDFFVDSKTPRRGRHPLLVTTAGGEILWVVGHRLAEAAKVDDATDAYLILSVRV